MPTILVPVDTSDLSSAAINFIEPLKGLGDFKVTLLHVSPHEDAKSAVDPSSFLDDLAARVATDLDLEVDWILRRGEAHSHILAEAANPWVAMLVMASHGYSGKEPWTLGSIADKTIRGAQCPTLVVSPLAATADAPEAFKRVLVPLDGSPLAEEVLPLAEGFARKLESKLRFVAAYLPPAVPVTPWPGQRYGDFLETSALAAESYLADVTSKMNLPETPEAAAIHGHPSEVLLNEIASESIDLVIMTSHGRHGFVRWALGSVTDRIIRGPAPVLVVQAGQAGRLAALMHS